MLLGAGSACAAGGGKARGGIAAPLSKGPNKAAWQRPGVSVLLGKVGWSWRRSSVPPLSVSTKSQAVPLKRSVYVGNEVETLTQVHNPFGTGEQHSYLCLFSNEQRPVLC